MPLDHLTNYNPSVIVGISNIGGLEMVTKTEWTLSEMWEKCKRNAKEGKDCNSGGLGRIKVAGQEYVGGFFLNLIMLYSPITGGIVKQSSHSCPHNADISLTPEEFTTYLCR